MGEKDLYDYWSDTYKVHTLDWSRTKAGRVLREWQKKFNEEVRSIVQDKGLDKKFDVNAFSSMNLDSILEEFSEFSAVKVAMGYVLMVSAWVRRKESGCRNGIPFRNCNFTRIGQWKSDTND